jgi:hypothetical protein
MRRPFLQAQAAQVERSDIETARRQLEEARHVLEQGRDGASPAWLEAVEDYIRECQEEYVRALEQAHEDAVQRSPARGWPSGTQSESAGDGKEGRKPN